MTKPDWLFPRKHAVSPAQADEFLPSGRSDAHSLKEPPAKPACITQPLLTRVNYEYDMEQPAIEEDKKKLFLNTLFWGFILWLFGYILGIIFFMFVPKDAIGFYVMPIGLAATIWVLLKKIERKSFQCYAMVGVFWAIIAVLMDYVFIVMLFNSPGYYKPDVYLYYVLTLILPAAAGWHKLNKAKCQVDMQ
ncbi:MAG: hypothetical protein WC717_00570 [Candidatus Micrarchaeia archaeon]|jgi:hypothetical protein